LANIKNETDQKTQDKFARFIAKHQIDISQTKEVQKVRREAERLKKELDHRETLLSKTREEKEDALKHARSEKLARQQAEQTLAQSEEKVASLEKVAYFQENQIDLLDSFTKSDITTLIGYLHHIGIYSDAIEKNRTNIGGLFKSLPADIKEILTDIDFDAKKISVLSRLGQRAFEELDDTADFDFIGYANQYIKKILKGTISGSADISVVNNTGLETFFLIGNPADVSVIIDNLINNSEKAKATHISIIFEKREKLFEMIYRDNGIGLLPEINDPKKIFELGFTTTKGSGIGLNHVSRIIEEMGGTVAVNPNSAKGFELIFSFGDKK
jgi:signal transduction histidine kinase